MKEKLKNFFTNKTLWEYIIGFFVLIILLFTSYSKGFVDGVLIDDDIRTELIDTTLGETKKSKIQPKKVNDFVKYSAYDNFGKTLKVHIFVNEDLYTDIYDSIDLHTLTNPAESFVGVSLFNGTSPNNEDYIDFSINFLDYQDIEDGGFQFYFDSSFNGVLNYITFDHNINGIQNLDTAGAFSNLDSSLDLSGILNSIGAIINTFNLDNFYFINDTVYPTTFTFFENNYVMNYIYTYDIQTPKSFLSEFLSGAVEVVTGFGSVLTASVVGISAIFYSNGELTIVGSAMALALGIGAIYLLFRMIRGLIKQNNRG